MNTRSRLLGMLLALGLVIAACSPAASDDPGTTAPAADTDTTAAPAPDEPDEPDETTTTAAEDGAESAIATDIGVDLDAGTITIGLLSDLTGPFGALVTPIVTGHEVYWEQVNESGGINGLQVQLAVRDTQYVVDNHVQLYEELKESVVAFGHSTGSPHTVAINPQLQEDGILAIPLTWYSGWTDPALNANLLHHGAPYCIEAMNVLGWLKEQMPDLSTLAIVSLPGDYGQDSAAGAKLAAEALGLEVVYDGEATITPTDEASLTEAADNIAETSPDMVWLTSTPTMFSSIFGQALARGYDGIWSGAAPSYSPAFVAPDSQIKDAITESTYWGLYFEPWSGTSAGTEEAKALLLERRPEVTPFDYYFEGLIEAQMVHEALLRAYDNGDMTQAGVLAAAKSLETVDFNGLAPSETYVGDADSQLQRVTHIVKPDPDGLVAGTSGGTVLVESNYTHEAAASHEFNSACYTLGS